MERPDAPSAGTHAVSPSQRVVCCIDSLTPGTDQGSVVASGIPLGLTATPGKTGETGKDVGYDNKAVFCDLLGLDATTYEQYTNENIIEDHN